jgi:hypothetical protein
MGDTVFFDLKEGELSVYTIDKAGSAKDVLSTPVGQGYSFTLGDAIKGPEESYLSLPTSMLNFRILELPFSDIKKIRELLPYEIDGLILGGSGNVVFDAYILGESNEKHRVLVAYILKDTLKTLLDRFKTSGFDPRVVTSVELSHLLVSASGLDIAEQLLTADTITAEKRISAATREMQRPVIDLRRDDLAYTADTDRTKKSLRITALLFALLLLIFFSDMTMVIISLQKENRSIKDTIRKTYSEMFPGEKKISNELYQLKAHIKELKEKESSLLGTSPLQLMTDLSGIIRPGTAMTEITIEKDLIVLKGECGSLSDVQKIKGELEGFLSAVNISDTRPSSQNKTLFTITAKGRKA